MPLLIVARLRIQDIPQPLAKGIDDQRGHDNRYHGAMTTKENQSWQGAELLGGRLLAFPSVIPALAAGISPLSARFVRITARLPRSARKRRTWKPTNLFNILSCLTI